jgi:hypothetical protein
MFALDGYCGKWSKQDRREVQAVNEKSDLTVLHASCHRQSIFYSPQLGVKLSDHELIGANWISDEHYSAQGLSGLFHMQTTRNEPF